MIELIFRHDGHVTKRAFRFKEVDRITNQILEQADASVGTVYMKKNIFKNLAVPQEITVKVYW